MAMDPYKIKKMQPIRMFPLTRTATGSYVSEARVMAKARAHVLSSDNSLGHGPPKLMKHYLVMTNIEKYMMWRKSNWKIM